MPIKILFVFLGKCPFLVVNLRLLLQIDVSVQGIVVELAVLNLLRSWLLLVCQEKVVHYLDSVHDLLLSKDVLDDHQSDIILELHDG